MSAQRKRVVTIGGGFAGLDVVETLGRAGALGVTFARGAHLIVGERRLLYDASEKKP